MIQSLVMGFGYRMRSGKDSAVAEIIKQRSGQFNIRQYSFAKALKHEVNEMAERAGGMRNLFLSMDLPKWVVYDPAAPMDDVNCFLGKQRFLLQYWGVYRREQEQDYWVNRVANQIKAESPELALISDLRFKNEFQWIKTYGDCIRVDRLGLPSGTHVSETELFSVPDNQWDAIIVNDGTLEEFKIAVLSTFDSLMNKVQHTEQGS